MRPFFSLIENEAVFSSWAGHLATQRRPTRRASSARAISAAVRAPSTATVSLNPFGRTHREHRGFNHRLLK
jgi:hypothetical protein